MGIARPQTLNRGFNDQLRCFEFRITDAQHDHVIAFGQIGIRLGMQTPCIGALAADLIDERRKFHDARPRKPVNL